MKFDVNQARKMLGANKCQALKYYANNDLSPNQNYCVAYFSGIIQY